MSSQNTKLSPQNISHDTIRRLVKDISSLHKSPLTEHGIYYEHDTENMLLGYAMIIGPKDTPYEGGFYFFKLNYPTNYPIQPPKVSYMTNNGKTRFHPNLYRNGKVCLSILNTWRGEGWTSCQTVRSILLVLVSILDEIPLLNEPGIHKHHKDVKNYTDIITYRSIEFAHLGMFKTKQIPDDFLKFKPIIKQYYINNKTHILSRINKLVKK